MAKSNTNKRYALRKLGKIFGSVIVGLTLFLGGILNTSFVHADGTGVTFIKDDTRRKGEEPETDVDEVGNIIVKVPAKDSVETKVIPIETEYEADPTLDKGKKKDDPTRPGEAGTETITTTYKIEGGKAVEDKKTSEVTTPMVKKVVKVGTKPTETTEPTTSTEVRYEKDSEHIRGSQPTTIPSEDGLKTVTTSYKVDSKTGDITVADVSETVTKAATPIIVKVPAKDSVETKVIPIETEYEADPTLVKGEKKDDPTRPGKVGTETITTTYKIEGGKAVEDKKTSEVTTEMVKKVVKVGTKPTETTEPTTSTEVRYEKDPEHTRGSQPTTIPSEDGLKTVTTSYKVDSKTGDITVADVSETVTKAATPIIVKVPAKDSVETKVIPIETEYEADSTLVKGEKKDDPNRQGKLGIRTITTTYRIENGKAVEDTSTEKVTTPMEKKIIKVGTKPTVRVGDIESKEVKFEKDLEHPRGSNPETIPGENGTKEITTTYKLDTNTGEVSELETTEKILTQPTPTVVKVPAKDKVEKRIAEKSTNIHFEKDETRDRNENPVTIDGEDGYVTTTTTYDVNPETGKVSEKVTVDRKEATDTVIKVPAKSKVDREVLPTSVIRYEKDESRDRGASIEMVDGEDGYVTTTRTYDVNPETGKVSEKVTVDRKEATDTVIKVPAKSKVDREVLPTSVIRYEKDESRDRGASIEMVDGEDGYVTTTTTYDVNPETGKVSEKVTVDRKEATDTVIKVPAKSKVDREVLPTSVIRYEKDETRDRGASIEMVDGEDGYVTTTTTYDVNPETGKVSETVTVDRKEATDTVIKVPAKSKVDREVL
ncbi:G5 domain-containing protein, partial [Streptococcus pseudopneumoniae]|uniref:G5 domain-containing protein n=1 Tax=Streptococcus pseudopneumoniae TaxID=257758 RepID=UPI0018B06A0E